MTARSASFPHSLVIFTGRPPSGMLMAHDTQAFKTWGNGAERCRLFRYPQHLRRRADSALHQSPWHFIWEGTGEHYFFNGTTAYWLMGWKDERIIDYSLERLHRLKINRLRVTIAGRTNTFYGEPVMVGDKFTVYLTPWPAKL